MDRVSLIHLSAVIDICDNKEWNQKVFRVNGGLFMNVAIIIAGGSGHRMGQDIPKQFINVYDKPVLIYTLEGFQKHPQIDAIEVVCIDG